MSPVLARPALNVSRILSVLLVAFLCATLGLLSSLAAPLSAYADTESALADAQARYDEVEGQLNTIADEYQSLSVQQADTLKRIEDTQNGITAARKEIAIQKEKYAELQDELAALAVNEYKNDSIDYLEVLLASSTFKDFVTNVDYLEKIYAKKMALIDNVTATKQKLDEQVAQLETDMKALEALKTQQQEQLDAMQAKQQETQGILNSLDAEVKELTAQKNQELLARAAQTAAMTGDASAYLAVLDVAGGGSAASVVSSCYATPSPGANWCAAWVTNVFRNAGVGSIYGDACDMYNNYCYSSDRSELQPGMIVAVNTNTFGLAGRLYGHVGIYIGNGLVMENIGYIATTDIDSWISANATLVPARWGWLGGVALS